MNHNIKRISSVRVLKFMAESKMRMSFQPNKKAVGKWIREEISDLGPAFIKLGQFLSTRNDILGKDIASELELLQDEITAVPFADLIPILNLSFKDDYLNIFSYIEPECLASASIGQVHKGYLKGNSNPVAIKIHKPFIAEKIRADIDVLKNILSLFTFTGNPRANEFNSIIKDYERFLEAELDFRKEMTHMMRFKKIVKDVDNSTIKIPAVSSQLSTQNVLIMEYVPSIKINDLKKLEENGISPKKVATNLINIFLFQIIKKGYVHCDPHPGNIGVLSDGTIVLYDFGNVVEFSQEFKSKINQLMVSLYQKDVEEFVDLLVQLDILYVKDNMEVIEIKAFFGYFFKYLETLDLDTLKFSVIQNDLQGKFQTNFRVNQDFLSLFRVFSLLDGTFSYLDNNFNYIDAIAPYTDELMNNPEFFDYRAKKDIQKLQSYPRLLQTTDSNILRLQQKTNNINKDFQKLQIFMAIVLIVEDTQRFAILLLLLPFYLWNNRR
jgi:ubiquinone biosynthesis protein